MIAFTSTAACQHCPLSLQCLRESWESAVVRRMRMRQCVKCNALYFSVVHQTYLCVVPTRLTIIPRSANTFGCLQTKAPCLEEHRPHYTRIY